MLSSQIIGYRTEGKDLLGLRVLGKTLRARTRGRLGVDMLGLGKVLVIMEGYICVADINSHKWQCLCGACGGCKDKLNPNGWLV